MNGLRAFDFSDHHDGRDKTGCLTLEAHSIVEINYRNDF